MNINRIVSFLPSATELIYEIGDQDLLFGVTHECKYPEEAKMKPRIINTVIDSENLSSKNIDKINSELLNQRKNIFVINETNLKNADPDLIITQETCEVCAAFTSQVTKAIQILEKKPIVYSMDPYNLDEILATTMELGTLLKKENQAINICEKLEKRIEYIKNKLPKEKPKVLAIEWMEPFFTAGHWIPEMVELAGGINLISQKGDHSRRLQIEEIENSDPEIIILMPCGFDSFRTIKEYDEILRDNPRWKKLKAVKNKKIFSVDANSFFSKPSIRTITGLEILAKIIHPEIHKDSKVPKDSFINI